uniref:Ig-like domain-containing protein n=1 Tax=Canis lupus familiaris TaxID=9615 RepID=A0A8C0SX71_CANLF
MAWTHLLLPVLTLCTGSMTSTGLNQAPSVLVALGQMETITCSRDVLGKRYAYWYQHKPSQAPVLLINKNNEQDSGIPDRFSGSNSGNTVTLTISGARAEDEAEYYCQSYDSSGNVHSDTGRWGRETNPLLHLGLPLLWRQEAYGQAGGRSGPGLHM